MTVVNVSGKVSDTFSMSACCDDGTHFDMNGYVPDSSLGGGDYVSFKVDNETGQIMNWSPLVLDTDEDEDEYEDAD